MAFVLDQRPKLSDLVADVVLGKADPKFNPLVKKPDGSFELHYNSIRFDIVDEDIEIELMWGGQVVHKYRQRWRPGYGQIYLTGLNGSVDVYLNRPAKEEEFSNA